MQDTYFKCNENFKKHEYFDSMENLKNEILKGIYAKGYQNPSKIQSIIIEPMYKTKRDVIAQAHSGTGKTAAFTISSLQRLDSVKNTQVLILSPTRELTEQTYLVYKDLSKYLKLSVHMSIGGTNRYHEITKLKKDIPHVVIGTPGRVFDMIRTGVLILDNLKCLILDEADEMLNFGFKQQLYDIFEFLPENVQVGLFSATMPKECLKISEKFMRNPITLLVKADQMTLDGINQYFINVGDEKNKFLFVCDLFKTTSIPQAIIFCNSKVKVDWLKEEIADALLGDDKEGITSNFIGYIHGDMEKTERKKALEDFRETKTRILVTSELISRGIDIQHVKLVINYDLPKVKTNYIHRIGRSGRMGRKGIAINIINSNEIKYLIDIRNHFHTQIDELPENYVGLF
jgi:superfamily II DNA/RNA helicase